MAEIDTSHVSDVVVIESETGDVVMFDQVGLYEICYSIGVELTA